MSNSDKKLLEEASLWMKNSKEKPDVIRRLLRRFEEYQWMSSQPLSIASDICSEDWVWDDTRQEYLQAFFVTDDDEINHWKDIHGNIIENDIFYWIQPELTTG